MINETKWEYFSLGDNIILRKGEVQPDSSNDYQHIQICVAGEIWHQFRTSRRERELLAQFFRNE